MSDLHDGGDADGGEVERVDSLNLHAGAEGARGLNVPEGLKGENHKLVNIIWVGRYCQNLYSRGRAENFPS